MFDNINISLRCVYVLGITTNYVRLGLTYRAYNHPFLQAYSVASSTYITNAPITNIAVVTTNTSNNILSPYSLAEAIATTTDINARNAAASLPA